MTNQISEAKAMKQIQSDKGKLITLLVLET